VALAVVLLLAWLMWITRGRRRYRIPTLGSIAENATLAEEAV
jgi:hypothetical protein